MPLSRNMQINQTHIKGYFLSNLSVACALLAFYFVFFFFFWKPKRLRDFRGKGARMWDQDSLPIPDPGICECTWERQPACIRWWLWGLHIHVLWSCAASLFFVLFFIYQYFFQSTGRGLKNGENFELLYKLAEKMNAAGKMKTANHIKNMYLSYGIDKENNFG